MRQPLLICNQYTNTRIMTSVIFSAHENADHDRHFFGRSKVCQQVAVFICTMHVDVL